MAIVSSRAASYPSRASHMVRAYRPLRHPGPFERQWLSCAFCRRPLEQRLFAFLVRLCFGFWHCSTPPSPLPPPLLPPPPIRPAHHHHHHHHPRTAIGPGHGAREEVDRACTPRLTTQQSGPQSPIFAERILTVNSKVKFQAYNSNSATYIRASCNPSWYRNQERYSSRGSMVPYMGGGRFIFKIGHYERHSATQNGWARETKPTGHLYKAN